MIRETYRFRKERTLVLNRRPRDEMDPGDRRQPDGGYEGKAAISKKCPPPRVVTEKWQDRNSNECKEILSSTAYGSTNATIRTKASSKPLLKQTRVSLVQFAFQDHMGFYEIFQYSSEKLSQRRNDGTIFKDATLVETTTIKDESDESKVLAKHNHRLTKKSKTVPGRGPLNERLLFERRFFKNFTRETENQDAQKPAPKRKE